MENNKHVPNIKKNSEYLELLILILSCAILMIFPNLLADISCRLFSVFFASMSIKGSIQDPMSFSSFSTWREHAHGTANLGATMLYQYEGSNHWALLWLHWIRFCAECPTYVSRCIPTPSTFGFRHCVGLTLLVSRSDWGHAADCYRLATELHAIDHGTIMGITYAGFLK